MVASGACFALLALSGIKLTSERDGRGSGLSEEREREDARPDSDIFVSEIQKNDISAVPSVSDFILSERERRDKEISKGKSAVRHSVNALSWAPCFHKNLVLSIYLSCRIEG